MLGDLPSQILWGTGNENVIDFEYPELIDSKRTWRRPAPGSVRARNAAGTTDAAVYGYDYLLAGRARWFDAEAYSNPVGLQAFIDWAGRGNQFRFVPDKNAPDFYVDGVTLDAPFEDPAPDLEEANGSQAIDLVLRNPTVDFGQALRGVMFEYAPGMSLVDPVAATFSRGSIATRIAKDFSVTQDAINVLRDRHYEGTLKTALFEASRQNLIENGDYEADAVGSSLGGGATIARDSAQAKFGSWSLKVTVANALGSGVFWTKRDGSRMAAVAATAYTKSVWVYAPAASVGKTMRFAIEWWNVTPAVIQTDSSTAITLVAGWQRVSYSIASPAGTVTVRTFFETSAAQGVFDIWVDLAQFEAGAFESSAIPTGTVAVTRNQDLFNWPHLHKPQAMFILAEFIERGSPPLADGSGPVAIPMGGAVFTRFDNFGGSYRFQQNNGVAAVVSVASGVPTLGQKVQLLGMINPDGSVREKQSINDAAETDGGQSAANALPANWSAGRIDLAHISHFGAYLRVKVGPLTFGGVTRDTIAKAQAA